MVFAKCNCYRQHFLIYDVSKPETMCLLNTMYYTIFLEHQRVLNISNSFKM